MKCTACMCVWVCDNDKSGGGACFGSLMTCPLLVLELLQRMPTTTKHTPVKHAVFASQIQCKSLHVQDLSATSNTQAQMSKFVYASVRRIQVLLPFMNTR